MPGPVPTREEQGEALIKEARNLKRSPSLADPIEWRIAWNALVGLTSELAEALAARRPAHSGGLLGTDEELQMQCEGGPPLTEADVEAVLRAVPSVCGNLKHPHECRETGCVETGYPDYPAMARAVLARFGGKEAGK